MREKHSVVCNVTDKTATRETRKHQWSKGKGKGKGMWKTQWQLHRVAVVVHVMHKI